jgi:hypothetical protein
MESEETNTENDEATPSREDVSGGPGDISKDESPYHSLSNPVGEPDPTEWPDPYEQRPDPREADGDGHTPAGAHSTSEPHPSQDPEARARHEKIERDKLDE